MTERQVTDFLYSIIAWSFWATLPILIWKQGWMGFVMWTFVFWIGLIIKNK